MLKSILDTDILSEYEIVYGLELKPAVSQLNRAIQWLNENEEITPTSADYMTAAKVKAAARRIAMLSNFLIASSLPLLSGPAGR